MAAKSKSNFSSSSLMICIIALILSLLFSVNESAPQAFRSGRGQPQWHHNAFHDVRDSIRSDVSRMLHSRAEVPFQVPLEVNIVLIGFSGDGGHRYSVDYQKLEEFLRVSFPSHRPSGLETREPLDIEHRIVYNVFPAGQAEMIALEKAVKENMIPAGTSREAELGMEVDSFLVDAKAVEPVFQKLYSFIFDMDNVGQSAEDLGRPLPSAIFVVNFDKVRMDPRNKAIDLDSLMYGHIKQLNDEEMKKQEGGYVYRYQYNGGGATQVWLSSGRFVVIDLSAGPCTYGKIETEEGSVGIRTMPRLQKIFSNGRGTETEHYTHDIFMGHISSIISTIVEHVIAPDVRFETVDMMTRLLIPIIVLQNHNRYNIMEKGHNYSINVEAIEAEVKKMVHHGQEVVIGGGSHSLHRHEKLAIALSKSMRGHSLQEMERSADVLAAGLLEMSDPSLSSRCYLRQHWMDDFDGTNDSILKHKPIWATYDSKRGKKNKRVEKREGDLHRTYGTRVIPVFVLSLADVDPKLMMEDDSLVWTSKDVVVVLEHQTEKIALSYVSEKERKYAYPYQVKRHILAGLASSVGGLCAPYEKASHAHERPVINWLWASGCHRFGPFSNTSQVSQMLQDVALMISLGYAGINLYFALAAELDICSCRFYARVDSTLHRIRETSEAVQSFAAEYLKTPLGEPVKGKKNKSTTELCQL